MLVTDQMGRQISIPSPPRRIISVVPSQTELLYDLGLEQEVVGITKFCVHPDSWFRSKKRVGGTKDLNMDLIRQLQPDLIIANKEENTQEQIESLACEFPVWISDIDTLDQALGMIEAIGDLTGRSVEAGRLRQAINDSFSGLIRTTKRRKVCYLIWRDPYMTVGGDTFIHAMLTHAGYKNVFGNANRYPEVDLVILKQDPPDLIFLSSEPYPFRQKHIDELQPLFPATRIILVDGEMFSWYGSRLAHAAAYFKELRSQIETID